MCPFSAPACFIIIFLIFVYHNFTTCNFYQDSEKVEEVAKQLLEELSSEDLNSVLEYCKSKSAFKFKKSGVNMVSPFLKRSLETMKTSSTTFKGQRGQRVFVNYI